MTIRKRHNPSPSFRLPPPYQPIAGEHAKLLIPGNAPYCAMMQVAAEDTHADYLICRGYDPRVRRFFEYDESDPEKAGIPVGKPYGNRVVGQYTVGQVFAAMIPLTRIGQTPGVAETSAGHPADLDEEIEILRTDDDIVVTWYLLDSAGGTPLVRFELAEDMVAGECSRAFIREFKNDEPEEHPCGYWWTNKDRPILVQDQAGALCGWGGWVESDGDWVRREWVSEETHIIGSIGDCWLPSDVTAEFGDAANEPVHEIEWMVEPCEIFEAKVEKSEYPYWYAGIDETLNLEVGTQVPLLTSRNKVFWENTPPTSVPNVWGWYVSDGAKIVCHRVSCHDYEPLQVACPEAIEPCATEPE
jgi:hypothetical protein